MDKLIERLKDANSTIPGVLLTVGALIAMFKETAMKVVQFVTDLGYTWNPNPTTIALVLIVGLGLKMIFLDGGKKETTRVILKDKE
jgi:hypothetical protein